MECLAPIGIRSPDRPHRSQSLYRLRCPGQFVLGRYPIQIPASKRNNRTAVFRSFLQLNVANLRMTLRVELIQLPSNFCILSSRHSTDAELLRVSLNKQINKHGVCSTCLAEFINTHLTRGGQVLGSNIFLSC